VTMPEDAMIGLALMIASGGAVCTALGVRILANKYVLGVTVCLVGGMILGRRDNNGDLC
jgi:hypothetical protein